MSEQEELRRRVYAGLTSYLDEPALQRALRHWDRCYAPKPGSSLQKFVFEIAADGELRSQRSRILVSLVQAVNVQADNKAKRTKLNPAPNTPTEVAAVAFTLLMTSLMDGLGAQVQHSLRLDILASLSNSRFPRDLIDAVQCWLNDSKPLRIAPQKTHILRALVNHTYVLLCERVGPVEADRVLARVVNQAQTRKPSLADAFTDLL